MKCVMSLKHPQRGAHLPVQAVATTVSVTHGQCDSRPTVSFCDICLESISCYLGMWITGRRPSVVDWGVLCLLWAQ